MILGYKVGIYTILLINPILIIINLGLIQHAYKIPYYKSPYELIFERGAKR